MRIEGWEQRLAEIIQAAQSTPYVLGQHDCFRLACRVEEAMIGIDRWPQWEGTYQTEREALELLATYGGSFEGAFDWWFGGQRADIRMARRGDVACYSDAVGKKHLGICIGPTVVVLVPEGLNRVPLLDCLCCWRIG